MAKGRVQRRLAAIIAVDVVGYSRLMETDETGTLAQLKSIRKELDDPRLRSMGSSGQDDRGRPSDRVP